LVFWKGQIALPMAEPRIPIVPELRDWHHLDRLIASGRFGGVTHADGVYEPFVIADWEFRNLERHWGPVNYNYNWSALARYWPRSKAMEKVRTREQVAEALEALEARVEEGTISEGDYLREASLLQREYHVPR